MENVIKKAKEMNTLGGGGEIKKNYKNKIKKRKKKEAHLI